jgi:NifB/MoaA-like Fe-S oxidoreductase
VLDEYPELASLAVVPLGISPFNPESSMREHTLAEARAVVDAVEEWQDVYEVALGRRLVHAADEYYLMAQRPFPAADRYDGFPMHEDGIGMARTFELEFTGGSDDVTGVRRGFFAAVDGPRNPTDYRTNGWCQAPSVRFRARRDAPIGILTGTMGALVLAPLVGSLGRDDVRVVAVPNDFFGGNTGVSGLMVGEDIARVLAAEPAGHRYLLPDVCLSDDGRFLDGTTVDALPRPVEVVATDGRALRDAIGSPARHLAGASRG